MKDINKDLEKNPKKQIQADYAKWVNDVCDECDWKTSITMEEVQAKYSRLAIDLAIKELEEFLTERTFTVRTDSIRQRIKYLQSLND